MLLPALSRFSQRLAVSLFFLAGFAFLPAAARAQAPQYRPPVVAPNSTLAGVDYNQRYEVYGGFAYTHFNAGPTLLQGANLGGFDFQGSYFLRHKWAAEGSVRGYWGTSGAAPNPYDIHGPAVSQYMFLGGPEYRALENKHGSFTLHALVGGAYGRFDTSLKDQEGNTITPAQVGFYNNQASFGAAFGGTIDLNRSPRWAFRIAPDANITDYSSNGKSDFKEQFGISVGVLYRFGHPIDGRRSGAPAAAAR